MKKIFFYIILLLSVLFGLSDEQLDEILAKTDDTLLAPNFTLKSLESRSFYDIKFQVKEIVKACEDWKTANNNFPEDIQQLIKNKFITLPDSILD